MSTLRNKLARLGSVGPGQVSPASTQAGDQESLAVAITPEKQGIPVTPAVAVASLRQAIARIMARSPVEPRRPADPSAGELPFVTVETPRGPLYVRHLHFEPQHRVGRFPVGASRRADPTMLSLLALDPSLASLSPASALYLDTETTGLSGGTGTLPFLLGLGLFTDSGSLLVEQLLLRRPGEEAPILERVAERLEACSMLVTFNGKAFDMPLVRTRFVMNRFPAPPALPHLDLLHVARRVHRARIGACSLGAVENHVLGFERVDDIPSGEVVARYAHFLRTGDESALIAVIEHNAWDVVAMVALVGLYGEPTDGLDGQDLAQVAATAQRARAGERAAALADEAVARGGGSVALRARAMIAKARGDRDRALADFESLAQGVDDPVARLELAKLYEHYRKEPRAALVVVDQGVAESPEATSRRRIRLEAKAARQISRQGKRDATSSKGRGTRSGSKAGQGTLPGVAATAPVLPTRARSKSK